jgi:hypothetical protein
VSADGGTTFIDLTELDGRDWVESVSYNGGTDVSVAKASIRIRRQAERLTLATLMTSKYSQAHGVLLDIANKIVVEVAVTGHDLPRPSASGDWVEVFRGEIDDVDWGKDPVTLKCRDQGHLLVDTFIEVQRVYGSPSGTNIETVIQDLLDDNINTPQLGGFSPGNPLELYSVNGTGAPAFNPSDSPGFLIRTFIQSKESLFATIRRLAQMIGFDVKYLWHEITGQFQLVWRAPPRPVSAQGTLTLTGQPVATETFTINATTVTAVAAAPTTDEFLIGSTVTETVENIVAALNTGSEAANIFADRVENADKVLIEWSSSGTAGNSIVFTEAMTNTTADGGGTLGGTQLGADGPTIPDFTFDHDGYFSLNRVRIAKQNIRNVQQVTFQDPNNLNQRITVIRFDAASIAKNGRRFMEMTEASASPIDTVQEAANLANIALNDLSEPDVEQSAEMRYFWPIEDYDLYEFEANNQHYDTNQKLAVSKFSHKLTRTSSRTVMETRGKPAGGIDRWLRLEGDNIRNPAQDLHSNDAPSSTVSEANVGVIIITYDDPRTMQPPIDDWAYTECHVNPGAGDFTPSVTTLKQKGRTTRFEIGGLIPGDTYSTKLVIIDERGNASATSVQIVQATQRVGPFHENLDGQQDQLIRNNDFNIFTLGTGVPPDNWELVDSTWQTDIDVVTAAADTLTGGNAIELNVTASSDPGIQTDFIPFTDDDLIFVGCFIKGDVTEADTSVDISVLWFDSAKASISTDTTNVTANNGAYEERNAAIFRAPTNTRYAKILVRAFHTGTDYDLHIDRVGAMRASPQAHRFTSLATNVFPVGNNIFMIPDFDGIAVEEVGLSYSAGVYTIEIPGPYIWSVGIFSRGNGTPGNSVHQLEVQIQHDSGAGFALLANSRVQSITFPGIGFEIGVARFTTQIVEMAVGDQVRSRARVSVSVGGSDAVLQGTNVFFAGKMMERNTK